MARNVGMKRPRTVLARLAFFLSRRSYGRVITPAQVYALDFRLRRSSSRSGNRRREQPPKRERLYESGDLLHSF